MPKAVRKFGNEGTSNVITFEVQPLLLYYGALIVHFDGHDLQYILPGSKDRVNLWKKDREYDFKTDNGDRKKAYCTPSVITHNGRQELISPGAVATESRNPKTGALYWTARTGGMNSSSRPIYRHGHVLYFVV